MGQQPTIETERLTLRPFDIQDAPELQRLIGERDIAATTTDIPHPYEDGMAEEFITGQQAAFDRGEHITFAITHREGGFLIGGISLSTDRHHQRAELGYWIGKPYWNQGFCTEAAKEVVRYGFNIRGLNRIQARHFSTNPASGRVMQKIGMSYEGCLRQSVRKWGQFLDSDFYAILKSEYEALTPSEPGTVDAG